MASSKPAMLRKTYFAEIRSCAEQPCDARCITAVTQLLIDTAPKVSFSTATQPHCISQSTATHTFQILSTSLGNVGNALLLCRRDLNVQSVPRITLVTKLPLQCQVASFPVLSAQHAAKTLICILSSLPNPLRGEHVLPHRAAPNITRQQNNDLGFEPAFCHAHRCLLAPTHTP